MNPKCAMTYGFPLPASDRCKSPQLTATRWRVLQHAVMNCGTLVNLSLLLAQRRFFSIELSVAATHCSTHLKSLQHTLQLTATHIANHCNTYCNSLQHAAALSQRYFCSRIVSRWNPLQHALPLPLNATHCNTLQH